MSDTIKVDPEKLKSTSREMESIAGQINTTAGAMMTIVTGIGGSVWGGEAASKFISQFRGLQDDIDKMRKMLKDQTAHLDSIADEYSRTEKQNQESASRLVNNVI